MKKVLFNLAVFILLFAGLANTAFAGNSSYSILVSCTIPAIPGVNVPLIAQDSQSAPQVLADAGFQEGQQEELIDQEQPLSTENDSDIVIARTIYSR